MVGADVLSNVVALIMLIVGATIRGIVYTGMGLLSAGGEYAGGGTSRGSGGRLAFPGDLLKPSGYSSA